MPYEEECEREREKEKREWTEEIRLETVRGWRRRASRG